MNPFSEEELQYLEKVFGLIRNKEVIEVRDAAITKGDPVWWRSVEGPELVDSNEHWDNIYSHPNVYQKYKPVTQITYKD